MLLQRFDCLEYIFSRDSDLTSTNVSLSVCLSVCKQYVKMAEIS